MEPTVRLAVAGDCDALADLMGKQLREHGLPVDEARLRESIRGVLDHPERGFFLVAARPGGAVGTAYVAFLWSLEHAGAVAWLEELYVLPRARGTGTGTALVRAACAEAAARGCRAVDLEVDSGHERVVGLYRREGFEPLARTRWMRRLR
jgi:GNAT superfamily N-acetyltransferase